MSEDMHLGIKISSMLVKLQEKIIERTIDGEDTTEDVHKYRLFTDELRALVKRWIKII